MRFLQSSKIYLLFTIVTWVFSSCLVTKQYHRPKGVVDSHLYRTALPLTDTQNIANISWDKMFTDTILQHYIHRAIDSNFDIRVAIQNIKITEAYLKQARAAFSPSISLQPSTQFQTLSLNTPQGNAQNGSRISGYTYGITGNLSWEADIWGKINSQKKAALATYLGTIEAHQAVKSKLVSSVANLYYQLLSLDAQKKVLEETITSRQQGLVTIQALKDAGNVTEVAVKQYQAQVLNAQAQLITINNNVRIVENAFCFLLAINPQPITRSNLNAQIIDTTFAIGVPYQILSNRPDVLVAEYDLMTAFEMTNVAKTNFYPSLRITASGGLQSVDFDKLFSVQSLFANVIGSLTQPLWNQRNIRSQYEAALAKQQIAYLNYRKTILNAGNEVSNALYNYHTQNQMLELKEHEFLALDTATQYSQDLLQNGMATYLDVLTAQQNALSAKLSYINAFYGRLESVVELYNALGGGK